MNKEGVLAVAVLLLAPAAHALEVGVAAVVGGQLLEQKSTDLSHSSLTDEITLGRTLLAGASLDIRLHERHQVSAEGVIGPYHNDIDRSCIAPPGQGPCTPFPTVATSYAVHYGVMYSYSFKRHGDGAFVSVGIGSKKYSYDASHGWLEHDSSIAFHGGVGYELAGKPRLRVEARCVVMPHNPFLEQAGELFGYGATQVELQIRASIRVPLSR